MYIYNSKEGQPLIIVYQNRNQMERMQKFGKVVFLDATYKGLIYGKILLITSNWKCFKENIIIMWFFWFFSGMTAYGYAFYCMLARDDRGHGTPLAYFILSSDTAHCLSLAMREVVANAKRHGIIFSPRCFILYFITSIS